jgi:hypothetical protein
MVQCEEHCTLHVANVRSWAAEINVRMAAMSAKQSAPGAPECLHWRSSLGPVYA